jgi:two-component system, cell cycle sensor histidine kinase and response regulator CckA
MERDKRQDFSDSSFKTLSFDFSTIKALLATTNRYRTLFENAGDAIFVLDFKGRILDVNRIACERLGYSRKELLNLNWSDIETTEQNEPSKNLLEKLRQEGHLIFETSHKRFDGKIVPIEMSSCIIEYDREPTILTIARDISERKESEKEKAVLQAQLKQAQKMEAIGTLAGGIAHDFNNILTPISGYTELALRKIPEDSKARNNLEQVLTAVQRAKGLVQQILTFSRQEGQQRCALEIKSIIKEALKLLRASLPSTIEIRSYMNAEGSVIADPTQIHQVMLNLCTNAHHAMRENGGTLEIRLEDVQLTLPESKFAPDLKPGPYVCLTISDTGHGMTEDMLERIFEPYFTTKPEGEGTGMGLSVVHGIVKGHGGDITVESEPEKGSIFKVFFPKNQEKNPKKEVSKCATPLLKGVERILIVDDEKTVTDVMEQMLVELGYHVTSYNNSLAALEFFRLHPFSFDLVISDMTMPKMTGAKLISEIHRVRPDIPVIMATGNREEINPEQAEAFGIRFFLLKPPSIEDLSHAVRDVLDSHKKSSL